MYGIVYLPTLTGIHQIWYAYAAYFLTCAASVGRDFILEFLRLLIAGIREEMEPEGLTGGSKPPGGSSSTSSVVKCSRLGGGARTRASQAELKRVWSSHP